jgi:tRNA (guanosine-2'-O-)-methyltransferase
MEDIFQSQNASAVVRTCECFGVQDIHIIQNAAKYSVNPRVLKGSHKWLNLKHYRKKQVNNAEACFDTLRQAGYQIVVTAPTPDCLPIDELPIGQKIAIVMGNELHGSSDWAMEHADLKVKIPMVGFTESLNISVSAAICLHTVLPKVRASDTDWRLTQPEKDEIRLNWYRAVVRRSALIEKEFLSRQL